MTFILRQLCLTIILLVIIGCSQGFSIGYRPDSEDSLQDHRPWYDAAEDKRSQMDYYSAYFPLDKRRRHPIAQRNFAAPRGKRMEATPRPQTGGSHFPLGAELVSQGDDAQLEQTVKNVPFLKIEKQDEQSQVRMRRAAGGDKTFLRIGRVPSDSTFLRIGRSQFPRVRRAPFLRIGRSSFLRIGRAPFLRIGRSSLAGEPEQAVDQRSNDQTFLRFGRASGKRFLRIGRANDMSNEDALNEKLGDDLSAEGIETTGPVGKRGLRIGKRILEAFSQSSANDLTPEELQLLQENKDFLLQYMESHPEIFDGEQNENEDAYFAFPRQGRAMSFYFPRMGRSGEGDLGSPYCCDEGVRKIYKIGKGTQELCADDKPCCPGAVEQEKVYKDIIITECAVKTGSDKFRNFINDE